MSIASIIKRLKKLEKGPEVDLKNEDRNRLQLLSQEVSLLKEEIKNAKYVDSELLVTPDGTYHQSDWATINLHRIALSNNSGFKLKIGAREFEGETIIQIRDFLLKHFPVEDPDDKA